MFKRIISTLTPNQIEIIKNFKYKFTIDTINSNELAITYSRSSGPGGQNVNKVNTKVDIRFHINSSTWIPDIIKQQLRNNNLNINKKDELIITSDKFRTQKQNYDDCLNKLQIIINNVCELPSETSEEKKE